MTEEQINSTTLDSLMENRKRSWSVFSKSILLAFIVLLTLLSETRAVVVPPSDPNIQYFGRWDWSAGNPRCTWPSLYLKAKFNGTAITANFTNLLYNGSNLINIVYSIDGGPIVYVDGATQFTVTGLAAGDHEIMISRRNEGNGAEFFFDGFDITGNIIAPNARPCVKFEFVGNSITCGLANENFDPTWNDGKGTWVANGWEQNSYRSYAPVLSRMMDAEYRIESHSGQGMYINLNNSLPEAKASDEFFFRSYYPGWAKAGWQDQYDFASDPWKADFFFTLLGTNDWSDNNYNQGLINKADYKTRYAWFIDEVFKLYPNTTFFVVTPILDTRGWAEGTIAVRELVNEQQALGKDVHLIDITNLLTTQQDFGNDWTHPTTKGHQTMADEIKRQMMLIPSVATKYNNLNGSCGTPDCNGDVGGTASVDFCGVCSGGNTGIVPNSTCNVDCNGDIDGTASIDDCGDCTGGNTGLAVNSGCVQDCNGDWGGTATMDACNECVGGNTGKVACGTSACTRIEFDGVQNYNALNGTATIAVSEANGALNLDCSGTTVWDAATVEFKVPIDFTAAASKKIWIRVKADGRAKLVPSLMDSQGNVISNTAVSGWNSQANEQFNGIETTTNWMDYTIDFDGNFSDEWTCTCPILENDITHLYLSVNPGWGTQWPPSYKDGTEITSGYTGKIEIDFVKVADENCADILTVGIENHSKSTNVTVFPNPTTSDLTIDIEDQNSQWIITNSLGQQVLSGTGRQASTTNLPSGVYFINAVNGSWKSRFTKL